MSQEHLDRLTAIDASFLHQEGPTSHMHVGALAFFEGPPPPFTEVLDTLRGRLHLVPRYRQKLAIPPAGTGRPLWVDDPSFSIEYHVRHTALPHPGSEEQLLLLAGRIFSQQLDRSKPLWEMWMVEGLDDGGFALITKTHHAMIDGIAGVDIAQVIFDLGPVPTEIPHPDEPWEPARTPTGAQVLAAGTLGLLRTGVRTAAAAAALATRPAEALRSAREAVEGLSEVAWAGLNPAPPTPLNVEIGPHRRYRIVRNDLADFKAVKDAFGGTVNDVVLTVVSGALRSWLHSRGRRTEGLELRALVPVSIRTHDQRGTTGNRIAAMRGPLPVYVEDPIVRLRTVKAGMDGLKESKQAIGAEVLANVQNFAPPTILAQASRLNFSTRLFNLIVTNVPGPQFPLYACGRQMLEAFPFVPIAGHVRIGIAIFSYNGMLNFGVTGDYDTAPDIGVLCRGVEDGMSELLKLAGEDESSEAGASAEPPAAKQF
jgi:diacylglycerol O-acyltransferase / wax synthase